MSGEDLSYRKAIARIREMIDEAERRGNPDAASAALATASAAGAPSVRTIDVFAVDARGAAFFTDGASGKARQLRENPRAALCWYWPQTRFQAMLEGAVEPLSETEADACWQNRPREKRLGSWASPQSQPLDDAADLRRSQEQVRRQFQMDSVPRPANWIAFRIVPDRIELWQSGWQRLRAKQIFEKSPAGTWTEIAATP